MSQFRSVEDYELFLYSLQEHFPSVQNSTLVLIIIFSSLQVKIDAYGYEVWRGREKLFWYNSQEHPNDASLQSSNPHHKHIPPGIKHHRIPAPEMSFNKPNIPTLIQEIEKIVAGRNQ